MAKINNSKKSLLANLPERHKKTIHRLSNEALTKMYNSREIALEYAKKGIIKTDPEQLNDEHIEIIADGAQVLARMILEERGILGKK